MLHALLSLFPIDRRDADKAAHTIATAPVSAALAWASTLAIGITVIAAIVLIGGAA